MTAVKLQCDQSHVADAFAREPRALAKRTMRAVHTNSTQSKACVPCQGRRSGRLSGSSCCVMQNVSMSCRPGPPPGTAPARAGQWRTHRVSESNRGKNSLSLATLSKFFPLRSTAANWSQYGSKGCTSVITCTRRSWATPKEHSVRNVAFLPPALDDRPDKDPENIRRDISRLLAFPSEPRPPRLAPKA